MHELSIAQSLIDVALDALETQRPPGAPGLGVTAVHVRVGALAGVAVEALASAFAAASQGTPLAGARLVIEAVGVSIWCESCGRAVSLANAPRLRCPVCGARAARMMTGRELEIARLEVVSTDDDPLDPTAAHDGSADADPQTK